MNISVAERRQIESEMIFRRMNEKVGDDLGALDAAHIENHELYLLRDDDVLLRFKCECSDENCAGRVALKLSEFQTIHTNRDTFIVLPNHEVDVIEKVIRAESTFTVVKKNNSTPEPGQILNDTTINNA